MNAKKKKRKTRKSLQSPDMASAMDSIFALLQSMKISEEAGCMLLLRSVYIVHRQDNESFRASVEGFLRIAAEIAERAMSTSTEH